MKESDKSVRVPGIGQVGIRSDAAQKIDALAVSTGISKVEIMSRVYKWFAGLPEPVQKIILWPPTTEVERHATRHVLELMLATPAQHLGRDESGGSQGGLDAARHAQ